jgi:hypothetical protein
MNLREVGSLCIACVAALISSAPSCIPPGPGPETIACFKACANEKDACILAATSADAIRACDRESANCGGRCPS